MRTSLLIVSALLAGAPLACSAPPSTTPPPAPPAEAGLPASVGDAGGSAPEGGAAASEGGLPLFATGGCGGGTVAVHLDAPASWTFASSWDVSGPSANWLTLYTVAGARVVRAPGADTPGRDCRACGADEAWTTAIGSMSGNVPEAGLTGTWDGTLFALGSCPGSSTACMTPECATPGPYEAEVCACPTGDRQGSTCSDLRCTTVTFDYPSAAVTSVSMGAAGDP